MLASMDIAKHQRNRWLQAVPTAQIAALLYLYSRIVPDGSTKERHLDTLRDFLVNAEMESVLPAKNQAKAALLFAKQLTEALNLID